MTEFPVFRILSYNVRPLYYSEVSGHVQGKAFGLTLKVKCTMLPLTLLLQKQNVLIQDENQIFENGLRTLLEELVVSLLGFCASCLISFLRCVTPERLFGAKPQES